MRNKLAFSARRPKWPALLESSTLERFSAKLALFLGRETIQIARREQETTHTHTLKQRLDKGSARFVATFELSRKQLVCQNARPKASAPNSVGQVSAGGQLSGAEVGEERERERKKIANKGNLRGATQLKARNNITT